MSSEFSWRSYRAALHESNPPCVPYLGVHLQDLLFIEEGNPDTIGPYQLINVTKRELVAQGIRELQTFQMQPYNLLEVPRIAALFVELPVKIDEELYQLSLVREPRGMDSPTAAALKQRSNIN